MYEIFEKLMKEKGVNAYKVAKATGISSQTLSAWKKGTYTPKQDKIEKLANYFNVSVAYLMGLTDIPNEELTEEETRKQIAELEERLEQLEIEHKALVKENEEKDKIITENYELLKKLSITDKEKEENEEIYRLFLRIKNLPPEQIQALVSVIEQFSK